jgi:hypothetical protein
MYNRAATHGVNGSGKETKGNGASFFEVRKFGKDIAIGGVGNKTFSGKTILPDGRCGHLCVVIRFPTNSKPGYVLIGCENNASPHGFYEYTTKEGDFKGEAGNIFIGKNGLKSSKTKTHYGKSHDAHAVKGELKANAAGISRDESHIGKEIDGRIADIHEIGSFAEWKNYVTDFENTANSLADYVGARH